VTVITVAWAVRRDNLGTEFLMPVLVLGVFSFLLFIAMGVLAISAVMSERNHDSREEHQGKV
jgi:hypothetical protein